MVAGPCSPEARVNAEAKLGVTGSVCAVGVERGCRMECRVSGVIGGTACYSLGSWHNQPTGRWGSESPGAASGRRM